MTLQAVRSPSSREAGEQEIGLLGASAGPTTPFGAQLQPPMLPPATSAGVPNSWAIGGPPSLFPFTFIVKKRHSRRSNSCSRMGGACPVGPIFAVIWGPGAGEKIRSPLRGWWPKWRIALFEVLLGHVEKRSLFAGPKGRASAASFFPPAAPPRLKAAARGIGRQAGMISAGAPLWEIDPQTSWGGVGAFPSAKRRVQTAVWRPWTKPRNRDAVLAAWGPRLLRPFQNFRPPSEPLAG